MDIEQFIRENIGNSPHMSLATSHGGQPWVCEVHFAYDDDLNLYFVSLQDTRHCQEIAANPKVAGNIVKQHTLDEAPNGVYFEGVAELIVADDENIVRYVSRLKRDPDELRQKLQEDGGKRMYKINVKHWAAFGNLDGSGNKKYEIEWNKS